MKKVMVQFNFPGMTANQYEQAWNEIRKTGNEHPKGLIHHVGTQQGNNLSIVDVWESKEAFNEFGKVLTPILNKIGAPSAQPVISEVLFEQQAQQGQYGAQGQYGTQGQPGNINQTQPGQYGSQDQYSGRSNQSQPGQGSARGQQPSNQSQQPGQGANRGQQPGQSGNRRNEEGI
jgi:hypothetical protein